MGPNRTDDCSIRQKRCGCPSYTPSHHEVLLRLQSDNGRLITPVAFLPAAVRFGLMAEIDTWLVEKAIAELADIAPRHRICASR